MTAPESFRLAIFEKGFTSLKVVHRGESSVVLSARECDHPKRRVALKVFRGDDAQEHSQREYEALAMLHCESSLASPLLYGPVVCIGKKCIVSMELVEGMTPEFAVGTDYPCAAMSSAFRALDFAHSNDFTHGGLSMKSIIIRDCDCATLVNWNHARSKLELDDDGLTGLGEVAFCAPDAIELAVASERVPAALRDRKSAWEIASKNDVWGLCVMFGAMIDAPVPWIDCDDPSDGCRKKTMWRRQ